MQLTVSGYESAKVLALAAKFLQQLADLPIDERSPIDDNDAPALGLSDAAPQQPAGAPSSGDTAGAAQPAGDAQGPQKPRRTRRTKAEMEAAREAQQAAPAVDATAKPAGAPDLDFLTGGAAPAAVPPAAPAAPSPVADRAAARSEMERYCTEFSFENGMIVLQRFGVKGIRDLKDEQVPLFVADLRKALALGEAIQ